MNLSTNKIGELIHLNKGSLRERITNFSKNYSVTAIPEYAIKKGESKQIIDVFLKISNKLDEADIAYFLIENKIKSSSAKKDQVSKQYEYFTQSEEYQKGLPVYSLLLTSDFELFSSMHKTAQIINSNSIWLKWTNKSNKNNSIESILRELLILEHHAEIQPINPNTQFILKSFIDYIVTEFSNSSNGQRNYNFNGSDEIEMAKITLNKNIFVLRRYENKMIRVFDDNDNVLDIEVRPLLKQINNNFSLGIETHHQTGTPKNTQVFGREVISAINSKK